jgi:hypothetical protein
MCLIQPLISLPICGELDLGYYCQVTCQLMLQCKQATTFLGRAIPTRHSAGAGRTKKTRSMRGDNTHRFHEVETSNEKCNYALYTCESTGLLCVCGLPKDIFL